MKLPEFLTTLPRSMLMLLAVGLIAVIGAIDFLTGPELSFSIFYLLPISLVAWLVGRRPAILASLAGAVAWLAADVLAGQMYTHPAIPYWNALVRLGFFLVASYSLSALKSARLLQEELNQFIVHDLRSPLGNVISGLETLKEVSGDEMDESEALLIGASLSSANRMLTLINSLLDVARLEYGKMQVTPTSTSLRDLVEASFQYVSNLAARSEVELENAVVDGDICAYADPDLAFRILVNLLSNAVRVSPAGSKVLVRAAAARNGFLEVSVADAGPGIPPKFADQVFDKFGQVEARRAGGFRGSGLGLAFCKLAVEAQSGRIWLESRPGQGTTVFFTLPAEGAAIKSE